MPPRYAFGYWWSRYWSYSDAEIRQLVQEFNNYHIPLDVLVVDMDWHWTEKGRGGGQVILGILVSSLSLLSFFLT